MSVIKEIEKLSTGFFRPPHIWGDHDFDGHGPKITIKVELRIENERFLFADCYMDARETVHDYTRARGNHTSLIYAAPVGVKMLQIKSDTSTTITYIDNNEDEDIIYKDGLEAVRYVRSVGDTDGSEAGIRTGFEAFLNTVKIEIEDAGPWKDYTTYISKVKAGLTPANKNGCSGHAGAALLSAYGISITPAALHNQIRAGGNLIAGTFGAAPPGAFRDILKRYLPHIVLFEGQDRAFDTIKSLVHSGFPIIVLQAWGSKHKKDYYAPSWDQVGMNWGNNGDMLHWIVLKGIDLLSRTFIVVDNGKEKRLSFDYIRNTVHFNKQPGLSSLYAIGGLHDRTFMWNPFMP